MAQPFSYSNRGNGIVHMWTCLYPVDPDNHPAPFLSSLDPITTRIKIEILSKLAVCDHCTINLFQFALSKLLAVCPERIIISAACAKASPQKQKGRIFFQCVDWEQWI
jgi:hypothetical protein